MLTVSSIQRVFQELRLTVSSYPRNGQLPQQGAQHLGCPMVQESQNNDDPPCDSTRDADPVDPRREAHLGLGDIGLRVSQIGSATLVEPAILVGDTTLVEPITRIESANLVGHTPLIRHTIPVAVRLRIVDRRSNSLLLALMSSACCRSSPRG